MFCNMNMHTMFIGNEYSNISIILTRNAPPGMSSFCEIWRSTQRDFLMYYGQTSLRLDIQDLLLYVMYAYRSAAVDSECEETSVMTLTVDKPFVSPIKCTQIKEPSDSTEHLEYNLIVDEPFVSPIKPSQQVKEPIVPPIEFEFDKENIYNSWLTLPLTTKIETLESLESSAFSLSVI